MHRKVVQHLLKNAQATINPDNPYLQLLFQTASNTISSMLFDIKKPFSSVCLHCRHPSALIPLIHQHNNKFGSNNPCNITVVDYVRNQSTESLVTDRSLNIKELRYIENPQFWPIDVEENYDLIISCLIMHHCNNPETLLEKYLRTLKRDGALIGCSLGEQTLKELHWSYLMVENERCGGISPKLLRFPELGHLGTMLTSCSYKIITILQEKHTLTLDSPLDLLSLLQSLGESGFLSGRRKGVYKDLLLAAMALYSVEFQDEHQSVEATVNLQQFIGWRQHQSQQRPLRRGSTVNSVEFLDQISKFDKDVEGYTVDQQNDHPKRIR